jgi:hypothetical protein
VQIFHIELIVVDLKQNKRELSLQFYKIFVVIMILFSFCFSDAYKLQKGKVISVFLNKKKPLMA